MDIKKKKFILSNIIFLFMLTYGYYFFFYLMQHTTKNVDYPLNVNYIKLIESLIFIFIISYIQTMYDINKSIYLTFYNVLFLFIYIPLCVFYYLSNASRFYFYMNTVAFLILGIGYILLHDKKIFALNNNKYIEKLENKSYILKSSFYIIMIAFVITDLVMYFKYGHSLFYLFHLDKVYDIRYAARKTVPNKLSYVLSWSVFVVIPTLIAYFIRKKKIYLTIIPFVIQILLFTIAGNKIYLFGLAFSILIYIFYYFNLMYHFVDIWNIVLALSLIIKRVFLLSILVCRTFIEPASISYKYYKFFSVNPKVELSSSIFKFFIHNQYKLDLPFIISRYMYKEPEMSANANYIANAYGNFGFIGVIIFSIMAVLIFILIERVAKDSKYAVLVCFSSVYALANSGLLTTMMNHGLIFSIIILFLFEKMHEKKINSPKS